MLYEARDKARSATKSFLLDKGYTVLALQNDRCNTFPMNPHTKIYFIINEALAVLALLILVFSILQGITIHKNEGNLASVIVMAILALCGGFIFLSRATWMTTVSENNHQITDNPDDYSLERTTFFAWVLLLIIWAIRLITKAPPDEGGLAILEDWVIALAFWTPIINIIGPSWGKLKAQEPNGGKITWHPCWTLRFRRC
ncbi:hypothetical protein [Corynebacterium sp. LaCa78]|uniref:hypothetical protein n=1 Tax=Corynebacterium sp. LaCa78 TaxID=3391430 RepID=UPI00398A3424